MLLQCVIDIILLFDVWKILLHSASFVLNTALAPALGLPKNPAAAAEAEKLLSASLAKIDSLWLKENRRFILGTLRPSIADLSLVCEIMQLKVQSFFFLFFLFMIFFFH